MNDTFSSQNSVAFYQQPATPTASTDPMMPAAAPVDQASMGGQVADQSQPAPVMAPQQTAPMAQPQTVPNQDVATQDMATSAPQPDATKPSPEEVVSRLADRIKAYEATTANLQPEPVVTEPSQAPAVATKPTPEEIVKRLADRVRAYEAKTEMQQAETAQPATPTPAADASMAPMSQPTVTPIAPIEPSSDAVSANVDPATDLNQEPASPQAEETLESQNIFELLGVADGTDAEKDAFLDQLQQVIWEDFLESDVQLLLTKSEDAELKTILSQDGKSDAERQELAVAFLEKLVPDLENIMLEKALELKKEMVFERIAGMRELHSGKPEVLAKVTEAEILFKQDKWLSGAQLLNSLK